MTKAGSIQQSTPKKPRGKSLTELRRLFTAFGLYLRTVHANPWIKHVPTRRQEQALRLDHIAEVLYGGAAGGGKSDWLLMEALKYVDVPGYAAILFRRTYSDLALPGALMDRADQWLSAGAAKWNDKTKTWLFPSGATLSFGYLENFRDHYRYQGAEFQFVGFDELTQFTEKQYRYLFSRLRRPQGSRLPIRMRAASNPGGIGHEWVKNRFPITGAPQPNRAFVPAKVADNPHLDIEEYIRSLEQLDEVERRRLLDGDWEIANEGLVYPTLRQHVIVPFRIEPTRCWAGVDWGYHNPAALIVGAMDHDDVLHIVEEIYGSGMTDDEIIAEAAGLRDRWPIDLWYCDPAEPASIEKFRRNGLRARTATNDVMPGISAVNARLRTGRLKVFNACKNLIRESGLYRYPTLEEKRIQGEKPIDEHNHALSALRYLIAGVDRVREVQAAKRTYKEESDRVPEMENPESHAAYEKPCPQTRYFPVEPVRDETWEQQRLREQERELTREHLRDHGWESWR
ncbi:MAG TPA: terminase family protein [Gemmataceae bacterium]|jgi:PBSX family phage terminase large subunit|nr:terminase family protein [Gemmataceae bacterium]